MNMSLLVKYACIHPSLVRETMTEGVGARIYLYFCSCPSPTDTCTRTPLIGWSVHLIETAATGASAIKAYSDTQDILTRSSPCHYPDDTLRRFWILVIPIASRKHIQRDIALHMD